MAAANADRTSENHAAHRQFAFHSLGELTAGGLQPIDWLVRDYFESDSIAALVGDPACGKTFVAIDLACCIASGNEWHGHKVKRGTVFYIAGEGRNGIIRRLTAWKIRHDDSGIDERLFISSRAAHLCSAAEAAGVANAVDEMVEQTGTVPQLIVVDTLARNFGGDENGTEDMGSFVSNLDAFLREKYRATVLVVHHTGKADKTQGRGSSAFRAALDAEYSVARNDRVIQVETKKMKDAREPDPIAFRMCSVELPVCDEEGVPATSVILDATDYTPPQAPGKAGRGKHQTLAMQTLRDMLADRRVTLTRSKLSPHTARVAMNDWRHSMVDRGIDRRRVGEVIDSLKTSGLIEVQVGGFVLPTDEAGTFE